MSSLFRSPQPPPIVTKHHLSLEPGDLRSPLTRRLEGEGGTREGLVAPRAVRTHPSSDTSTASEEEKAKLFFVGTATTILEWGGLRLMTDPNFLHKGDHVHLGPGVYGTRVTDPAFAIDELPHIDIVVLSHFHEDHFDRHVQHRLRKDLPIISTTHARRCLMQLGFSKVMGLEPFEAVAVSVIPSHSLDRQAPLASTSTCEAGPPPASPTFGNGQGQGQSQSPESGKKRKKKKKSGAAAAANEASSGGGNHDSEQTQQTHDGGHVRSVSDAGARARHVIAADPEERPPAMRVVATPGKHVTGVPKVFNDVVHAIPPTNGHVIELGWAKEGVDDDAIHVTYRIYISGDTLFVNDLKEIPARFPNVDLMLAHLGGTTVPSPNLPLVMVTMDAKQGVKLVRLIKPKVTIPIHNDDYDVFVSPRSAFEELMEKEGLAEQVVCLDRGDVFKFKVPKDLKGGGKH